MKVGSALEWNILSRCGLDLPSKIWWTERTQLGSAPCTRPLFPSVHIGSIGCGAGRRTAARAWEAGLELEVPAAWARRRGWSWSSRKVAAEEKLAPTAEMLVSVAEELARAAGFHPRGLQAHPRGIIDSRHGGAGTRGPHVAATAELGRVTPDAAGVADHDGEVCSTGGSRHGGPCVAAVELALDVSCEEEEGHCIIFSLCGSRTGGWSLPGVMSD
jgi:hypothetical protein